MDRHTFNTTVQKPDESMQFFVSTLKILSKKCEFGALTDELIRDRIVWGIQSDTVRKQLLHEKNLTLESAININRMLNEQSERGTKELRRETEVCAIKVPRYSNCDGSHPPERCKCFAFNKRCNNCGRINHFARCCRPRQQNYGRSQQPRYAVNTRATSNTGYRPSAYAYQSRMQNSSRVNEIDMQSQQEHVDTFYFETVVLPHHGGGKEEAYATFTIACSSAKLTVKVDTGAKCNVMSKQMLM